MQTLRSRLPSFSKQKSRDLEGSPTSRSSEEKHQALAHRAAVAEGLGTFARDFVLALDGLLLMINKFLEVVQSLDPEWLGVYSECTAHVSAMSHGIKSTAPSVRKELKKHLRSLESVADNCKAAQTLLDQKTKAQQERNHYLLKLQTLHDEQAQRDSSGRSSSADQLQRLARNEEKLIKAQQALDECNTEVEQAIDDQLHRGKMKLITALHGVSQVTACGLFISTGALVCQALSQSEASESPPPRYEESHGSPEGERSKSMPAESSKEKMIADEPLEVPSRLNPEQPFGEKNTVLEWGSPSPGSLERLSIPELKECLRKQGLTNEGCIERADLIERLLKYSVGSVESGSPTAQQRSREDTSESLSWPPSSPNKQSEETPVVSELDGEDVPLWPPFPGAQLVQTSGTSDQGTVEPSLWPPMSRTAGAVDNSSTPWPAAEPTDPFDSDIWPSSSATWPLDAWPSINAKDLWASPDPWSSTPSLKQGSALEGPASHSAWPSSPDSSASSSALGQSMWRGPGRASAVVSPSSPSWPPLSNTLETCTNDATAGTARPWPAQADYAAAAPAVEPWPPQDATDSALRCIPGTSEQTFQECPAIDSKIETA